MRLASLKQFLISHGSDLRSAEEGARRMLSGMLMQQSMILSFEKLFLLAGIAFLCVLPLVMFLRAPKLGAKQQGAVDVHIEV